MTKTDIVGIEYPPVPPKDMEKAVGKVVLLDERPVVCGRALPVAARAGRAQPSAHSSVHHRRRRRRRSAWAPGCIASQVFPPSSMDPRAVAIAQDLISKHHNPASAPTSRCVLERRERC